MAARNQYLHALITERGGYHLRTKGEKSKILDEYCAVTGEHRKAVSRKVRTGSYIRTLRQETGRAPKRTRSSPYTKEVTWYLIRLWELFDRPCGQRLHPIIQAELDRLRTFGELQLSDEMAATLKRVSPRTIDARIKPH